MCKRGDVYYVDFGHNIESCKQSGIRTAVIVSNNRANVYSPVITVVPLTSRIHKKGRSPPMYIFHGAVGQAYQKAVWLWQNRWRRLIKNIYWKRKDLWKMLLLWKR